MKILAIASAGGHWVELLRLLPAFSNDEIAFISTNSNLSKTVESHTFYAIKDYNRNNISKAVGDILKIARIIKKEKPTFMVSTGAAPGLIALFIGKILGKKTIWIDTIASVEKLSLSGKLASFFVDRIYTQWEHLSTNKIIYKGNVIL